MLPNYLTNEYITKQVAQALSEDIGQQDLTASFFSDFAPVRATLYSRAKGVFCGQQWFEQCFQQLDDTSSCEWFITDGEAFEKNQPLVHVIGNKQAIVTAERSALNFVQLLSGTATTTAQFVEKIAHTSAKLYDTRKTIPGLRLAQKYAVTCGGGYNHRLGLWDAVLLKENHLAYFSSPLEAVQKAKQHCPGNFVIVEVETQEQLVSAISAKPDRILLDNFSVEELRQAVEITSHQVPLEASGNVNLDTIEQIALTGVDAISCGSLTKNVIAIDLSLLLS